METAKREPLMSQMAAKVLPFNSTKRRKTFTLRLSDDSMIGAGLAVGSLQNFIPTTSYVHGDCVAVETPHGLFVNGPRVPEGYDPELSRRLARHEGQARGGRRRSGRRGGAGPSRAVETEGVAGTRTGRQLRKIISFHQQVGDDFDDEC